MATPRVHAAQRHAHADGATIQGREVRAGGNGAWLDCTEPVWHESWEYRVKPEREYITFDGDLDRLRAAYNSVLGSTVNGALEKVANATLRHAIDAQTVVPMAEVQEVARELAKKRELLVAAMVRDAALRCIHADHEGSVFHSSSHSINMLDLPAIIASIKD